MFFCRCSTRQVGTCDRIASSTGCNGEDSCDCHQNSARRIQISDFERFIMGVNLLQRGMRASPKEASAQSTSQS